MASDLIYREDAKVFVRHACYKKINPIDYLDEVPAADVADVVRCRDCIHDNSNDTICPIPWVYRHCESFCSFGERRSDND